MATLSVFVMCWRTKMPHLNSASLWQNTTDISVQILYRLPRIECKRFCIFFFCFASLNFNLTIIASALSLMCVKRRELIFLTIQQSLRCSNLNFCRSVYLFRYCNSHLQVLGIVPKKNRRKKPGEGCESEVNSSSSTSESRARTDVLTTPASTNMSSIPPQLYPFRLKKPKNIPQKRAYTNIPAIEELRESRRKWQKDRADLFKIYGKNIRNFVAFLMQTRVFVFLYRITSWHLDNLKHENIILQQHPASVPFHSTVFLGSSLENTRFLVIISLF